MCPYVHMCVCVMIDLQETKSFPMNKSGVGVAPLLLSSVAFIKLKGFDIRPDRSNTFFQFYL